MNDREQEVRDDIENLNARVKKLEAAPQEAGVTLGYSKSKGQYHVDEIRGDLPVATYQCFTDTSDPGDPEAVIEVETIRVHAGDWLTQTEAGDLGLRAHLTVRPYRLDA